jgi:hypothetical protein
MVVEYSHTAELADMEIERLPGYAEATGELVVTWSPSMLAPMGHHLEAYIQLAGRHDEAVEGFGVAVSASVSASASVSYPHR